MSETWIILGATSSMARAFARAQAERGARLVLAGRDLEELRLLGADLQWRGAAETLPAAFDARRPDSFAPVIETALAGAGMVSVAVFVGSMPAQAEIDADPALLDGTVQDSFTGPARFLQMLAPELEARGGGSVVGVGSVAGDRGRLSNHVYGAAKAGFATYLSGLRNRLGREGVHVLTVKPGFVDTAMTWGLDGMFLVASPEAVAARILKALEQKRNVIYAPGFWRLIMTVIRLIPEPIFRKLSI